MATYKTEAIILSSYPYREHDRIVSVFSRDFGRIEARARGVRKIESKLAGHLEPFIKTELLLANGRRWDIMAGSRTRDSHSAIRADIAKTAAASVCVEAVKRATKPFSRERGVYERLDQALGKLDRANTREAEQEISARLIWDVLSLVGFGPELFRCINCKYRVAAGTFSFEGGGVLCDACRERDIFAYAVDTRALDSLRDSRHSLPEPAQTIVRAFWNHVLEEPIASWSFFSHL